MVNVKFPKPVMYGFEMVDAPKPPHVVAARVINRKFTPNPGRNGFGAAISIRF
jgi:hypothetical protein